MPKDLPQKKSITQQMKDLINDPGFTAKLNSMEFGQATFEVRNSNVYRVQMNHSIMTDSRYLNSNISGVSNAKAQRSP